jgi:hypothetical protein
MTYHSDVPTFTSSTTNAVGSELQTFDLRLSVPSTSTQLASKYGLSRRPARKGFAEYRVSIFAGLQNKRTDPAL